MFKSSHCNSSEGRRSLCRWKLWPIFKCNSPSDGCKTTNSIQQSGTILSFKKAAITQTLQVYQNWSKVGLMSILAEFWRIVACLQSTGTEMKTTPFAQWQIFRQNDISIPGMVAYPGYFREPLWKSMGFPEISRVTWQPWTFISAAPW